MAAIRKISNWLVVALMFVVAFPVALNNLVLALFMLAALPVYGGSILAEFRRNPVARAAGLLFGLLMLGTLYGATELSVALDVLGKYADLAMIPLFVLALREEGIRLRARYSFLVAMALIACVSWLVGLHVIPWNEWVYRHLLSTTSAPENPSVFHSHITQGMLMAYAGYLFALEAVEETLPLRRAAMVLLTMLTTGNVLLLKGQTGYVTLFVLMVWFGWVHVKERIRSSGRHWGRRHVVAAFILPFVFGLVAYHTVPRIHDRIEMSRAEFAAWQPHVIREVNSTGDRLEFYYNSLSILAQHPLVGVGTGGFKDAYEQQVHGTGLYITNNPHNEYLLIAAQVGIAGLFLLLYLFYIQWRSATKLATAFEQNAARGLVLTLAVTCLFNSNLHDHVPGMFFALLTGLWFARLGEQSRHA